MPNVYKTIHIIINQEVIIKWKINRIIITSHDLVVSVQSL